MDFPAWATPGELRKIYSKARTLGADNLILSDVDAVKGYLEEKSAGNNNILFFSIPHFYLFI